MPLTWDYTETADFEAIEPSLRQTAPFMCMTVGIGHITEDNVEDFYRRVNLTELATGAFRFAHETDGEFDTETNPTPYLLTPDEARSLVGMRCNVTPMTKAKFKGHLFTLHERFVTF